MENALQALDDPNESVTVRTFADPDRAAVILECSDQGRGIDPAIRDRLFEPFFTTKRDSGGTGLGLPVALGIVRESGGGIEIDSTPGRGTTDELLSGRSAGAGAERMSEAIRPPLLIVDDDPDVLKRMERLLRFEGFPDVILCDDPRAVSAIVAEREISVMVLDLLMPLLSGQKILQETRERHPEIPVIVATAVGVIWTAQ